MLGPSIATLVMRALDRRAGRPVIATGLRIGDFRRRWPIWVVAACGLPLLVFLAIPWGEALGVIRLDMRQSAAGQILLEKAPEVGAIVMAWPHATLFALSLFGGIVASVLNAPLSFAEEWGWRGYLLGRLLPLGQSRALMISGVCWGLWHAPIVALGYNYPVHRNLGPLLMVCFCVMLGALIGWMRLAAGSLWPAVMAHGALNGTGGIIGLLGPNGSIDTAQATLLGWSGWILLLVAICALKVSRLLPAPLDENEAPGWPMHGTGGGPPCAESWKRMSHAPTR
jgi:membrane protease YdiL (CAAX protease family)